MHQRKPGISTKGVPSGCSEVKRSDVHIFERQSDSEVLVIGKIIQGDSLFSSTCQGLNS